LILKLIFLITPNNILNKLNIFQLFKVSFSQIMINIVYYDLSEYFKLDICVIKPIEDIDKLSYFDSL
jgi:hypothetical protein